MRIHENSCSSKKNNNKANCHNMISHESPMNEVMNSYFFSNQ